MVERGVRAVRRGLGAAKWSQNGGQSYEGLPPEVGAFKFKNDPHAPWPVHNFSQNRHFYANSGIRGVGVIPWLTEGFGGWWW